MKMVVSRVLAAVCIAGLPLGLASADVPGVLDRVPVGTPVVVSIGNVNAFFAQAEAITGVLQQQEAQAGIQMAKAMLSMPGINAEGSAAIAITSIEGMNGEGDEEQPPMVVLLPVSDYAALVANFGGTGEGLEALNIEGSEVFARDIGGGYAAVGPMRDVVEAFDATEGNTDEHEAMLGDVGQRMAAESTILVIANMDQLREPMMQGWDEASKNMEQMMAMGGQAEQGAAQIKMIDGMVRAFGRDAQRGLVGISGGEYGLSFEMGASFIGGSELAGTFAQTGNAERLLKKLPGGAYLFAYAMDYSSPGIQKLLTNAAAAGQQGMQIPGLNPMDFVEQSRGMASAVGLNPAGLMGGLFVNTTAVMDTPNAEQMVRTFGESITAANGQVASGFSMTTSFAGTPEQIGGVEAYKWSMQMLPDMNTPNAMQMQMMMPMLFGPSGGPNGYIAAADESTTVVTYSTSTAMLESLVKSAREGGSLATDQLLMKQSERLHDDAFMVAYMDVGTVMKAVLPTIAMFAGPVNVEVPEAVTPVAMSMSSSGGGVGFRTVIPADVIDLMKKTGEAFGGMQGGMGGGAEEEAPPSF